MNFVVCSYSFPPRSGPECFCTARFVSALAREGHSVHVVTMDHPAAISQATYDFLVDKRVKITRVPMKPNIKRFWPRLPQYSYGHGRFWSRRQFYKVRKSTTR